MSDGRTDTYRSYREELLALEARGLLRALNPLTDRSGAHVRLDGRRFLNLCANDYLGLATNMDLHRQFYDGLNDATLVSEYGLGSSASRLMSGTSAEGVALEQRLEALYGRPALVFNSGYHANLGMLSALCGPGDLVVSDRLNHASIIDGMRLSGAKWVRYRHADYDQCAQVLQRERSAFNRCFLVSESIFSMDGDVADLQALVALKRRYDTLLYVDEAHAVGVRGAGGLGVSEEAGLIKEVDVLLGTFGKALASMGAYGIMDATLKQVLVNRMRPFIFSTALPPVVLSWNRFILGKMAEMAPERAALKRLVARFRQELGAHGVPTRGTSQIVPVILGANQAALDAAQTLREHGVMVLPVRPPTVPPNTARLRLSLAANMAWDELAGLPAVLAAWRPAGGVQCR